MKSTFRNLQVILIKFVFFVTLTSHISYAQSQVPKGSFVAVDTTIDVLNPRVSQELDGKSIKYSKISSPITAEQLDGAKVFVISGGFTKLWKQKANANNAYSDTELNVIRHYVENGGILIAAGVEWPWSYKDYGNNDTTKFPLNMVGSVLGFKISGQCDFVEYEQGMKEIIPNPRSAEKVAYSDLKITGESTKLIRSNKGYCGGSARRGRGHIYIFSHQAFLESNPEFISSVYGMSSSTINKGDGLVENKKKTSIPVKPTEPMVGNDRRDKTDSTEGGVVLTDESEAEKLRLWTNSAGKELEARLMKLKWRQSEGNYDKSKFDLILKKKDGNTVSIPLETLSGEDQKLTTQWLQNNPTGNAPPKPPYFWPSRYSGNDKPKVVYIQFDENRQMHFFQATHFDLYMDERLSDSMVEKFVAIFESIIGAIDSLPMQLDVIPNKNKSRYQAYIISTKEKYEKLGGLPQSSGVFLPSKSTTLLTFESLGIVRTKNGWDVGKDRSYDTLIHELTHHATSHLKWKPDWTEEGFAMYMDSMPYRSGAFMFANPVSSSVMKLRKEQKDSAWAPQILPEGVFQMTSLEQLMNFSYIQFHMKFDESDAPNRSRNYLSSQILVCYFMHLEGEGDGRNYIEWLHKWNAAILKNKPKEYTQILEKYLLRGRSYAELEADIQEKMKAKGLRINFVTVPGGDGTLVNGRY